MSTYKLQFEEKYVPVKDQVRELIVAAQKPESANDEVIARLSQAECVAEQVDKMIENVKAILIEHPADEIKFTEFKTWVPLVQAAWDGLKAILACFGVVVNIKVPAIVQAIVGFLGFKL